MSAPHPRFYVRDAGLAPDDSQFIVEAFDSALPYLESIGSSSQWGSQPFSEKEGYLQETSKDVEQSEEFRLTRKGDPIRIFIAEVDAPSNAGDELPGVRCRVTAGGETRMAVGVAQIKHDYVPGYVASIAHLQPVLAGIKEKGSFGYVEVVVTDFRVGAHRKGAGLELLDFARQYARNKGFKTLLVDSWADKDRKLNK